MIHFIKCGDMEMNNNSKKDKREFSTKDIVIGSCFAILFILDIVILGRITELKQSTSEASTVAEHQNATETSTVAAGQNVVENQTTSESTTQEATINESTTEVEKREEATKEESTVTETIEKKGEGKTIYLTFDDGPSQNTRTVLDILDKYGVKATFFVVRPMDEDYKSMYKEVIDRGHSLGMHSLTHNYDQIYADIDAYKNDVYSIRNYIYEATGYTSEIYRFPGGSSSTLGNLDRRECIRFLNSEGIVYFDWNSSSGDASVNYVSISQIEENVFNTLYMYDDSIVLMHDSSAKVTTVAALSSVIERGLREGFTFKAITKDTTPVQQILATGVN